MCTSAGWYIRFILDSRTGRSASVSHESRSGIRFGARWKCTLTVRQAPYPLLPQVPVGGKGVGGGGVGRGRRWRDGGEGDGCGGSGDGGSGDSGDGGGGDGGEGDGGEGGGDGGEGDGGEGDGGEATAAKARATAAKATVAAARATAAAGLASWRCRSFPTPSSRNSQQRRRPSCPMRNALAACSRRTKTLRPAESEGAGAHDAGRDARAGEAGGRVGRRR